MDIDTPSPDMTPEISQQESDENMAKRIQEEEDLASAQSLQSGEAKSEDSDGDVEAPKFGKLTSEEKTAKFMAAGETKEAGNALFKAQDNDSAILKWAEAVEFLEEVSDWMDTAIEVADVRALRLSLYLNTAAACNKLEKWEEAVAAVEKATNIDANNVKAVFRRGVAYAGMGKLDEAKDDFTVVAKADTKNREARDALSKVKARLKEAKEAEKERMKNLFNKSMYEDKEKEKKAKAKADAQKAAEEAAAKQEKEDKMKKDWEAEKARRAETEEEEISFEDFEKQVKDEEKKREDEEKKKREEQKELERKARAAARAEQKTELEVDEDDEKLLADIKQQGYCYFKNDAARMREKELGDFTPRRIETPAADGPSSGGASAWNAAGTTVEERDYTTWTAERLEAMLKLLQVSDEAGQEMSISKVDKVEGLANICVIKGTARPHIDVQTAVDWEATVGEKKYKGKIRLPEVTIEGVSEGTIDMQRESKKKPAAEHSDAIEGLHKSMEAAILACLADFISEFRGKC